MMDFIKRVINRCMVIKIHKTKQHSHMNLHFVIKIHVKYDSDSFRLILLGKDKGCLGLLSALGGKK